MSDTISPLAGCVIPAKYYYRTPRKHAPDWIMVHCTVGQCTAASLGAYFASGARQASSNYGVGRDGSIGCYVPEEHGAYCCSYSTDARAISIETSSDNFFPYAATEAALEGVVRLCVDICCRYGKRRLLWLADRAATLAFAPAEDEMALAVHRWFAEKSCPGEYIYQRLGDLAGAVNERLEELFMTRYQTVAEVPEWGRATVRKLCAAGLLQGRGGEPDEDGYPTGLDLSDDMLRMLVINDRAGVYGGAVGEDAPEKGETQE